MIDSLPAVELTQTRGAPPAAVQVIAADPRLTQRPLADWLQAVPGLHAAERGNHAQDAQLSVRGFGARTAFGVRGLRIYVDGIPQSTPDGSGSSAALPLGLVERIEVVRGPFSALYGSNSGGVIALHTRAPRAAPPRAQLLAAAAGERALEAETGGEGWRLQAAHWQWEGWRPQSRAERQILDARLAEGAWAAQFSLGSQRAQDPQGLSPAQWAAEAQGTAAQALAFDTRKRTRFGQLGLRWQQDGASVAAWWGRRTVQQWQSIPVAVQAAPAHPGGVIALERGSGGIDARQLWQGERWRLTAGLALEVQEDLRRGYENFIGSRPDLLGVQGALRRDERNHARGLDAYLQTRWQVSEATQLHAGLRAGRLQLGSRDRFLVNGDDSGARALNTVSPMLGLSHRRGEQLFYANAGAAQETPTLNELAYSGSSGGFNPSLRAQRSRQLEAGWRWQGWQLGAFVARSRDEILVAGSSGGRATFANAGRSRRQGLELSWRAELGAGWEGELALSTLSARLQDGARLPGAPAQRAHAQLRWQQQALSLQARWQAQSELFAAPAQAAPGFGLLHVMAQWQASGWRLQAGVDNLFDRRHAASVIVGDANGRFLEPGAPRRVFIGLSLGAER